MTDAPSSQDTGRVKTFLTGFQTTLCAELSALDGGKEFDTDTWIRETGGGGTTRTLVGGQVFEKAGVAFSHVFGDTLPPSATAQRPELAGRHWEAMGVSLVLHPHNPHVPTTHANVRFFRADADGDTPVWWFGGGFDLTPYYGYSDDCVHWHQCAKDAVTPYGSKLHDEFKAWCDRYFYIRHRQEARGIGGLFFDDFSGEGFEHAFGLQQSVAQHFIKGYEPIVQRRKDLPYNASQREWQLYRRGRYVEFNLVQDRGTLFGLQSGGRTESILMSLPPMVSWVYAHEPASGSEEERLLTEFLPARDWLSSECG